MLIEIQGFVEKEPEDLPPLTDGFLGDLVAHTLDTDETDEEAAGEEGHKPWEEQVKTLFGHGDEDEDEDDG